MGMMERLLRRRELNERLPAQREPQSAPSGLGRFLPTARKPILRLVFLPRLYRAAFKEVDERRQAPLRQRLRLWDLAVMGVYMVGPCGDG